MEKRILVGLIFALATCASSQPTSTCPLHDQSCAERQATEQRYSIMNEVKILGAHLQEITRHTTLGEVPGGCMVTSGMFAEILDNLYVLSLEAVTWPEARERCASCGYQLLRIHSRIEQLLVRGWLNDARAQLHGDSIWMDGTDEGHKNCWVWSYPEITPFSQGFTSWHPGQPETNDQRCNCLYHPSNWNWHDNGCNKLATFICKKSVDSDRSSLMPTLSEVQDPSACPGRK